MANQDTKVITLNIHGDKVAVRYEKDTSEPEDLILGDKELNLKVLNFCNKLIQADLIQNDQDFKLIGQLLHKVLFTKTVKHDFNLVRAIANRPRVELEFTGNDSRGLSSLPWEYLCYEEGDDNWRFLSTVTELVLTRYLQPNAAAPKVVKLKPGQIDVLLVVLNPDPVRMDDLAMVERHVKDQLDKYRQAMAKQKIEVVVDQVTPPVTWERFSKKINEMDCRPHILHLIAHGKFDGEGKKDRSGKIAFHLTDEPEEIEVGVVGGNIDMIRDRTFVNLFAEAHKLPRFAFLHMCEGGAIDKHDTSAGVALCLAQEGVPAVVAMQHKIEIETSIIFSETFYQALGNAQTIDEAVQDGRRKIAEKNAHNRAFGTPVLYLSLRSDPILPIVEKHVDPPPPPPTELLDTDFFVGNLLNIILDFPDKKNLSEDKVTSVLAEVKRHLGKSFKELKSELEKRITECNQFDKDQLKLTILYNELLKKIKELGK